jgi:hypothetical protein
MRFLVLSHPGDETALRVHARLRSRHGPAQVRLVYDYELATAPYWAHRIEAAQTTTRLRLRDGTALDSDRIGVVFNRLVAISVPTFGAATPIDRDYANSEMLALCMSWLASLPCSVVNPASAVGLSAGGRGHLEWLGLAARAGLPTQNCMFSTSSYRRRNRALVPHRWLPEVGPLVFEPFEPGSMPREPAFYFEALATPRDSALVAMPSVLGNLGSRYAQQLRALAHLAGCDLLQVFFGQALPTGVKAPSADPWKVYGVSCLPQVHSEAAVASIVRLLEAKVDQPRSGRLAST